jgi:exodeoxyribonuclease V alpha subunit
MHILFQEREGHIHTNTKNLKVELDQWLISEQEKLPQAEEEQMGGEQTKDEQTEDAPNQDENFLIKMSELKSSLNENFKDIIDKNREIFGTEEENKPFVHIQDKKYLYIRNQYKLESRLIELIKKRISASTNDKIESSEIDKFILSLEKKSHSKKGSSGFQLTSMQKEALKKTLKSYFTIISGGPGTGKTTAVINVLRGIIFFHRLKDLNIAVAAPTGRAAIKILDSINQHRESFPYDDKIDEHLPDSCFTIHKLLGFRLQLKDNPRYNAENPLPYNVIVLDEASMIDLTLIVTFLEALPDRCRIIILGDKNQLPSVDSGAVLNDLISGCEDKNHMLKDFTVMLDESLRSDKKIQMLSRHINAGKADNAVRMLNGKTEGLSLISLPDEKKLSEFLSDIYPLDEISTLSQFSTSPEDYASLEREFDKLFRLLTDKIILCPLNHGAWGINRINRKISEIASPQNPLLYAGMPIMILRNDYELNLFNGDKGILVRFPSEWRAIFPNTNLNPSEPDSSKYRSVDINRLSYYSKAYALTIHKSQGSEYGNVIIFIPELESKFVTRELLYTAVSRAKRVVTLVGSADNLKQIIPRKSERYSRISELLHK